MPLLAKTKSSKRKLIANFGGFSARYLNLPNIQIALFVMFVKFTGKCMSPPATSTVFPYHRIL